MAVDCTLLRGLGRGELRAANVAMPFVSTERGEQALRGER